MPSSNEEIKALSRPEYWNERYLHSDGALPTHEWFRSFEDLHPFLSKHLFKPYDAHLQPKILHLGAGDSSIPRDLHNHGYKNQICLDFSPILVQLMSAHKLEGVTWVCADVRDMPDVPSASIDIGFDKATLDGMIHGSPWDPPDEVKENASRYMKEVARVLKANGTFLYVTYRQPHFVKPLLNQDALWEMEVEVLGNGNSFEYYAFTLTKAGA